MDPSGCDVCGGQPDGSSSTLVTWVRERDERGRDRMLCPQCIRRHVRDIEARLDAEWW